MYCLVSGGVFRGHHGYVSIEQFEATRAKTRGLHALLTTNDEPNMAMSGINAKLGYQTLPAHMQLEKILSRSR